MEQLKLSDKLVEELKRVMIAVDKRANDPYVMVQYLAAIIGYVVGRQEISMAQKSEIHEELSAFAKHVMDDIDQTVRQQKQQPSSAEAFGIWRPGDD